MQKVFRASEQAQLEWCDKQGAQNRETDKQGREDGGQIGHRETDER